MVFISISFSFSNLSHHKSKSHCVDYCWEKIILAFSVNFFLQRKAFNYEIVPKINEMEKPNKWTCTNVTIPFIRSLSNGMKVYLIRYASWWLHTVGLFIEKGRLLLWTNSIIPFNTWAVILMPSNKLANPPTSLFLFLQWSFTSILLFKSVLCEGGKSQRFSKRGQWNSVFLRNSNFNPNQGIFHAIPCYHSLLYSSNNNIIYSQSQWRNMSTWGQVGMIIFLFFYFLTL